MIRERCKCAQFSSAIPTFYTHNSVIHIALKRTAPLLFGILSASSGIGVMLGLILGALMLGIYIDFDKDVPQLTDPYEAGFLGAWWLSFIIAGALALIFAVPMWGFPNQLKGVAQIKLEEQEMVLYY